jgi:hypothetical protein
VVQYIIIVLIPALSTGFGNLSDHFFFPFHHVLLTTMPNSHQRLHQGLFYLVEFVIEFVVQFEVAETFLLSVDGFLSVTGVGDA